MTSLPSWPRLLFCVALEHHGGHDDMMVFVHCQADVVDLPVVGVVVRGLQCLLVRSSSLFPLNGCSFVDRRLIVMRTRVVMLPWQLNGPCHVLSALRIRVR